LHELVEVLACPSTFVSVVGPSNLVWSGRDTLCGEGGPYSVLKLPRRKGSVVTERDALLEASAVIGRDTIPGSQATKRGDRKRRFA